MKPLLTRSPMTETIYIVTRYTRRVMPNGAEAIVAHAKYEVTDRELAAIGLQKLERMDEGAAPRAEGPTDPIDSPVEWLAQAYMDLCNRVDEPFSVTLIDEARRAASSAPQALDVEQAIAAIKAMKVWAHERHIPASDWISIDVVLSILRGEHPHYRRLAPSEPTETGETP